MAKKLIIGQTFPAVEFAALNETTFFLAELSATCLVLFVLQYSITTLLVETLFLIFRKQSSVSVPPQF